MNENTDAKSIVRADAAARAQAAWTMRLAGHDWNSIAVATGFSAATNAARAVRRHMETLPNPDQNEMRQVLRERAEWLWQQMRADVEARRSGASRAAVALLQRMAVAEGTDAPLKVEVTPDAQQFEQVVQRLVAAQRGTSEVEEVDLVEYEEIDAVIEDGDPTAEG